MNRTIYFLLVFTTLFSACQGAVATQPSVLATESPITNTTVEVSTAVEISVTQTPTFEPIDLAGPLMQVGSKYTYIDGAILVAVPGGPFLMGYNNFGEKEHEVTLGDFWIYSNKITNGQYARCVESGQCTVPDLKNNPSFFNSVDINLPVTGVTYDQSAAYCQFVHGRLPTEAEWEKTARGPDGNLFPWGNGAPVCDLLNFDFCKGKPTDVTSYPEGVSYYSALDMSGNAREWVADWYNADYYDSSPAEDPLGPELGEKRSVRGSSYQDSADPTISAHRFSLKPTENLPDLGFRCVVEDPTYYAPFCQALVLYGADANGNPTDDTIPLPESCLQPQLSQTKSCQDKAIYISIDTFPLPDGAQLTVPEPECLGGPPTYKCVGTGSISIVPQSCTVPIPPEGGKCSAGYTYDAQTNTCIGKGPGQNCVAGFNYDPALQCCTAVNPDANSYAICPPGFYQQGNACLPAWKNPPTLQTVVESFAPVDCSKPDVCVPVDCKIGSTNFCIPVVCP